MQCRSNFKYADNDMAHLITALAFGFCITSLVYATAHTSGGHINPAVTLGLTIMGVCHPIQAVLYMFVQFLGATVGAALVRLQAPGLKEYGTNKRARFGGFVNGTYQENCIASPCDGNLTIYLTDAFNKPSKLHKHLLLFLN